MSGFFISIKFIFATMQFSDIIGQSNLKQVKQYHSFYFPAIDGLRFFAFLLVFIYHLSPFSHANFFTTIGWTGVHLFFLLSGFLLTRLLVEEYKQSGTLHLYKYFIRRILRIWPLYFTYLFIVTIASLLLTDHPFSLQRLLGNLFFCDNILIAFHWFNPNLVTGHLWSMSLEEQYYLVLPFLIPWLVKQKKEKIKMFILIIFFILFATRFLLVILHTKYATVYVLPFSADCFVAGIVLGLGIFDPWIKKINTVLACGAGTALLIVVYFLPPPTDMGPHIILIYFILAVAFFFLFIAVVYGNTRFLQPVFTNKPVRYLGKISFGLYVFHVAANYTATYFYSQLGRTMDPGVPLLSLAITISLAIVSYELLEKRFLKMKSRFTIIKNRDI